MSAQLARKMCIANSRPITRFYVILFNEFSHFEFTIQLFNNLTVTYSDLHAFYKGRMQVSLE